jgi:hypothetical protein
MDEGWFYQSFYSFQIPIIFVACTSIICKYVVLVKVPWAQAYRAGQHVPRVVDRGNPLDGRLSGYNMESLTVDHNW